MYNDENKYIQPYVKWKYKDLKYLFSTFVFSEKVRNDPLLKTIVKSLI